MTNPNHCSHKKFGILELYEIVYCFYEKSNVFYRLVSKRELKLEENDHKIFEMKNFILKSENKNKQNKKTTKYGINEISINSLQ
jgi:hypothetical protein